MRALLAWVFYEFSYWVISFILIFGFSLRVAGRRHIPRRGAALLVANHESFLDPVIVGAGMRRHLHYLGRKTLFAKPVMRWLLGTVNVVPIDQDGVGKDGLRAILGQLQKGRAVVVFPEGERCLDGAFHALRPGILLLIRRVQAPIIPIGIAGAFEAWPRFRRWPILAPLFLPPTKQTLAMAFGPPRHPDTLKGMTREQMLQTLYDDIAAQIPIADQARRR